MLELLSSWVRSFGVLVIVAFFAISVGCTVAHGAAEALAHIGAALKAVLP